MDETLALYLERQQAALKAALCELVRIPGGVRLKRRLRFIIPRSLCHPGIGLLAKTLAIALAATRK